MAKTLNLVQLPGKSPSPAQCQAQWYNLSWPIYFNGLGGRIERIEDLSTSWEMEKAKISEKEGERQAGEVTKKAGKKAKKKGGKAKNSGGGAKAQGLDVKKKEQVITFRTTYQAATGTLDIQDKLEEIEKMVGASGPLVIGRVKEGISDAYPRVFGEYEMQLTKASVSNVEIDELGRMIKAVVSFTLTETKGKKVKKAATQHPGASAKAIFQYWKENPTDLPKRYLSAVKVSPTKAAKKALKNRKKAKKKGLI